MRYVKKTKLLSDIWRRTKTIKKYGRKPGKLQRQLAHKKQGSNNYYKAKKQILQNVI